MMQENRMVALKAHFDGRVLVPEEPVDLPQGRTPLLHVQGVEAIGDATLTGENLLHSGFFHL